MKRLAVRTDIDGAEAGTNVEGGEGASRTPTHGTVRSVRWIFWLNAATLPMSFVTNLVLGRRSAEVLGLYTAIQVLIGTYLTFFVFGGNAVFTRLVPRLAAERRFPFLMSYIGLVLGLFTAVTVVSLGIAGETVRRALAPFGAPSPLLAYALAIVVVVWAFCSHFLYAVESARSAAFALKLVVVGYFVLSVACLTPAGRTWLDDPARTLWTATAVTYVVAAVTAAAFVARAVRIPPLHALRTYLPDGFWPVVAYTHLGTVVEYVYAALSSSVVLLWLDVGSLGRLSAALRWVTLLALLPGMLVSVVTPGLTRLENTGKREEALRQARVATRAAELAVVPAVLALVLFAPWLMGIFGAGYRPYAGLLRIVALSALAGPTVYLGGGLAVAFGALRAYLGVSLVYVAASVALNLVLVPAAGLIGAAAATTVSAAVQAAAVSFIIRKLGFRPPRSTPWGAVIGAAVFAVAWLLEPSWIPSALLWAAASAGFAWAAGLTVSEARLLVARLTGATR